MDLDCVGIPLDKMGLRRKLKLLYKLDKFHTTEEEEEDKEEEEEEEEDEEEEEEREREEDDEFELLMLFCVVGFCELLCCVLGWMRFMRLLMLV